MFSLTPSLSLSFCVCICHTRTLTLITGILYSASFRLLTSELSQCSSGRTRQSHNYRPPTIINYICRSSCTDRQTEEQTCRQTHTDIHTDTDTYINTPRYIDTLCVY